MGRLVRILSIGVLSFNVCAKRDQAVLDGQDVLDNPHRDNPYACPNGYEHNTSKEIGISEVTLTDEQRNRIRDALSRAFLIIECGKICDELQEECQGFKFTETGRLNACRFFIEAIDGNRAIFVDGWSQLYCKKREPDSFLRTC